MVIAPLRDGPQPPFDLDEDFAQAMRAAGAVRPAEIASLAPGEENADLVFQADNAVGELKTLVKDPRAREDFNDRLYAMHAEWVRKGLVPIQPSGRLNLSTQRLPPSCGRQLTRFVTRRIADDVTKANRQIRSTKTSLGMPDAKGLLFLCNTGCPILSPHAVLWALHHALPRGRHRSINWVIYFTFRLPITTPAAPYPSDIWAEAIRSGSEPIPRDFGDRLNSAWFRHLARTDEVRVHRMADPSPLYVATHSGRV